jgi:glycosyltransferase involved in cell wall biosynthesis
LKIKLYKYLNLILSKVMFVANLAKTITNLPPILTTIEFHHQKSFRSIVTSDIDFFERDHQTTIEVDNLNPYLIPECCIEDNGGYNESLAKALVVFQKFISKKIRFAMNAIFNKVLFVGPDYKNNPGGIASVLESYSKSIQDFKFVPTHRSRSKIYNFFFFIRTLYTISLLFFKDREIKIVHVHSASRASFLRKSLVAILSKIFKKKVVLHIHGGEFHYFYDQSKMLQKYIRRIFSLSDSVVCLSSQWFDYYSRFDQIKKLTIINNPVSIPLKTAFPNLQGPIQLLFLGRIDVRKGIYDLVEAINCLPFNFKEQIHLTIGGDGDITLLKEKINKYNLGKYITYAGWVTGKKKDSLLECCHLFVLPSYNEGIPISILEAMSFGKAVLSTNVGGIPEIVKPNINGVLITPAKVVELSEAIKYFCENRTFLTEYGKQSKEIVKSFSSEKVILSLQNLYKNLLS